MNKKSYSLLFLLGVIIVDLVVLWVYWNRLPLHFTLILITTGLISIAGMAFITNSQMNEPPETITVIKNPLSDVITPRPTPKDPPPMLFCENNQGQITLTSAPGINSSDYGRLLSQIQPDIDIQYAGDNTAQQAVSKVGYTKLYWCEDRPYIINFTRL
jgi:hypothetical protein